MLHFSLGPPLSSCDFLSIDTTANTKIKSIKSVTIVATKLTPFEMTRNDFMDKMVGHSPSLDVPNLTAVTTLLIWHHHIIAYMYACDIQQPASSKGTIFNLHSQFSFDSKLEQAGNTKKKF
jgi:hypothetical protein